MPIEGHDDEFIISRGRTLSILKWTPGSDDYQILRDLHEVDATQPKNRFNDGKCDAKGRLWAGTMGPEIEGRPGFVGEPLAALYMIDSKGCHVKLKDVELSNGLGWSADNKTMYFVDSPKRSVDAFDFDLETGDMTNRRVLYHLDSDDIPGVPDGLTIDFRDNIWLAVFSGGRVSVLGRIFICNSFMKTRTNVIWRKSAGTCKRTVALRVKMSSKNKSSAALRK